jgi:hypothetical protein
MGPTKRNNDLRNRGDRRAFLSAKAPLNDQRRLSMQRELSPVEARSGVVSGRVFLVLVSSFIGAAIALGLAWFIFARVH